MQAVLTDFPRSGRMPVAKWLRFPVCGIVQPCLTRTRFEPRDKSGPDRPNGPSDSGVNGLVEVPSHLLRWARRVDRILRVLDALVDVLACPFGRSLRLTPCEGRQRRQQQCGEGRDAILPFLAHRKPPLGWRGTPEGRKARGAT